MYSIMVFVNTFWRFPIYKHTKHSVDRSAIYSTRVKKIVNKTSLIV